MEMVRLLAERRIGQQQAEPFSGVLAEAVVPRRDRAGVGIDPVEVEVHDAETASVRDQFPTPARTPA